MKYSSMEDTLMESYILKIGPSRERSQFEKKNPVDILFFTLYYAFAQCCLAIILEYIRIKFAFCDLLGPQTEYLSINIFKSIKMGYFAKNPQICPNIFKLKVFYHDALFCLVTVLTKKVLKSIITKVYIQTQEKQNCHNQQST